MNRTGLVTLSEVPSLGGKSKRPTKTITIARLDNNLKDPRYGAFSITQKEVDSWKRNLAGVIGGDSWKRNLAGVMGGQVSIDADHSSDRGQGTRAMGWITSINREGKHLRDGELMPRYRAQSRFTLGLGDGPQLPVEGPRLAPVPGDLLRQSWTELNPQQVEQLLAPGTIVEEPDE